jgi:hypothetical protein
MVFIMSLGKCPRVTSALALPFSLARAHTHTHTQGKYAERSTSEASGPQWQQLCPALPRSSCVLTVPKHPAATLTMDTVIYF